MIDSKEQAKEAGDAARAAGLQFHESASGSWHVYAHKPMTSISYWPIGAFRSQLHGEMQKPEATMSMYSEDISGASKEKRDREIEVLSMLSESPDFSDVVKAIVKVASKE